MQSLTGSLDVLAKLRAVTFEWKNREERGYSAATQYGFIAQEVEKVKPEWVGVDAQGFKTLDNTKLQVMRVDGVRTLKMENDDLRDRVRALEAARRPHISGMAEGGIGFGVCAGLLGSSLVLARRKRSDSKG